MHPYYPPGVEIPNYLPNITPLSLVLPAFGLITVAVLGNTLFLAKRVNRSLTAWEQATFCWFVLCGFLHCFFEGYLVLNHATIPSSQGLFAQLWKEYALSDSRYMTSDPFVLCIENITVFVWGPLCWAVAGCIVQRSRLRHPLQIITCIGHLYGVALYYGTCHFEYRLRGTSHSRPEFLYYWVYYVGFNFPWVVVPAALLRDSVKTVYRAFETVEYIDSAVEGVTSWGHESEKKRS